MSVAGGSDGLADGGAQDGVGLPEQAAAGGAKGRRGRAARAAQPQPVAGTLGQPRNVQRLLVSSHIIIPYRILSVNNRPTASHLILW